MAIGCIVMFSGGLDSVIAAHLLKNQGLDVLALHFVLPFDARLGKAHQTVRDRAQCIGVPLRIQEQGEEFLDVMKHPVYGFGKNANPCMDCRIHRIRLTHKIMTEVGASFIATGEVVGQRPMSQRLDAMNIITRESGLAGLILRPLSAHRLPPTIPETNGWVNRELLLGISGRGRKEQLAYAARFGLQHGSPGGGCSLTNEATADRIADLAKRIPDYSVNDFTLVAYGRHFWLSDTVWLIIARDDDENYLLERLTLPSDHVLFFAEVLGPYGILRGPATDEQKIIAGRILARYSKARLLPTVGVTVTRDGKTSVVAVVPGDDALCGKYRAEVR